MYYVVSIILLIIFIWYLEKKFFNNGFRVKSRFNFNFLDIVLYSLTFTSICMIFKVLLERSGFIEVNSLEFSFSVLLGVLFNSLFIPFIEEYFFRYVPFRFVSKKYYFISIVVVNLIFAFLHNVNFIESAFIFVMGCVLTIVYLRKKNIWYSVMMHQLYNLVSYVSVFTGYKGVSFYLVVLVFCFFGFTRKSN